MRHKIFRNAIKLLIMSKITYDCHVDVNNVLHWYTENKMEMNTQKTRFVNASYGMETKNAGQKYRFKKASTL